MNILLLLRALYTRRKELIRQWPHTRQSWPPNHTDPRIKQLAPYPRLSAPNKADIQFDTYRVRSIHRASCSRSMTLTLSPFIASVPVVSLSAHVNVRLHNTSFQLRYRKPHTCNCGGIVRNNRSPSDQSRHLPLSKVSEQEDPGVHRTNRTTANTFTYGRRHPSRCWRQLNLNQLQKRGTSTKNRSPGARDDRQIRAQRLLQAA
jgi:hypothetical protein